MVQSPSILALVSFATYSKWLWITASMEQLHAHAHEINTKRTMNKVYWLKMWSIGRLLFFVHFIFPHKIVLLVDSMKYERYLDPLKWLSMVLLANIFLYWFQKHTLIFADTCTAFHLFFLLLAAGWKTICFKLNKRIFVRFYFSLCVLIFFFFSWIQFVNASWMPCSLSISVLSCAVFDSCEFVFVCVLCRWFCKKQVEKWTDRRRSGKRKFLAEWQREVHDGYESISGNVTKMNSPRKARK